MAKGTYGSILLATQRPRRHLRAGRRPATPRSSRSRPSSRTASATAPSATPPATWSASRSSARHGQQRRHDEQGPELRTARRTERTRRQPRPDPRAGRAGEQPQGRQRRDPEAPADGVHRRLRLGQELAGVRHHRRRVAADDQRDLQRVRAGLHAEPGPPGGRPARGPDDGDHRRPGADGRQPPLHGRHRHRRQRDAADPVQPARRAVRRAADGLLLQRPHAQGERRHVHGQGRPGREERRAGTPSTSAACARAARAWATSATSTSPRCTTRPSRSARAR